MLVALSLVVVVLVVVLFATSVFTGDIRARRR